MKKLVIYHGPSCLDGFTAAWVASRKFGEDAEYLPAQYGDPPPDVIGRDVLIVDFSYPREVILGMHAQAGGLRVFDHHKTAQADLQGLDFAVFDMDRSGAGITWDELFPGEPRPALVNYVEDRDLWRFRLPDSEALTSLLIALPRTTWSSWSQVADELDDVEQRPRLLQLAQGVSLAKGAYVREVARQAITMNVLWSGSDGVSRRERVPVINAPYFYASDLAGQLAQGAPFAMAWFQRQDGRYQYSLRSRGEDGVDVSEVAKSFGGGGHRGAAGFESISHASKLFRLT